MDEANNSKVLTINAGSSSIKFTLFELAPNPSRLVDGIVDRIGLPGTIFQVSGTSPSDDLSTSISVSDYKSAVSYLMEWLTKRLSNERLMAIGHRIVHGGPKYYKPQIIDAEVSKDISELAIFDPAHVAVELQLIESLGQAFPDITQIACFDTAFHHNLPKVTQQLPIPRHYIVQGLRRYGFHGLSYEYVMSELPSLIGADRANGRLILAHLGNGVSLTAVNQGQSIDTTMGLTPAGGVPMSTRAGDLDPGVASYLANTKGFSLDDYINMINFKSGLLGISETTSDMKELLELESTDPRAKEAVDLFCYQVKKCIGGFAAILGGVDALVFTGGMGENAPKIRQWVCDRLDFLGIVIDHDRNATNKGLVSSDASQVAVVVVHTDEELTIVRNVQELLEMKGGPE